MEEKNVLLVSASPDYLASAIDQLSQRGINVIRASDAKDGFMKASEGDLNLIICALELPEMSASAFVDLLKAQLKTEIIPVLVAGSYVDISKAPQEIKGVGWLEESDDGGELASQIESAIAGELSPIRAGKPKVMAVDDSPIALKKYQMTLEENGFEYLAVQDPKAAIEAISSFKPHVILMDQLMPDINGFELTEKILAQEGMEKMKIIMVSSDQKKETVVKALQLGAVDFLMKPFDDEVLLSRIRKFVSAR